MVSHSRSFIYPRKQRNTHQYDIAAPCKHPVGARTSSVHREFTSSSSSPIEITNNDRLEGTVVVVAVVRGPREPCLTRGVVNSRSMPHSCQHTTPTCLTCVCARQQQRRTYLHRHHRRPLLRWYCHHRHLRHHRRRDNGRGGVSVAWASAASGTITHAYHTHQNVSEHGDNRSG